MTRRLSTLRAALALALVLAPSALALEPGQQVLARWDLDEDVYHYAAEVVRLEGDEVLVRYQDGSSGRVAAAAVVGRALGKGDLVRLQQAFFVVQDYAGGTATLRPVEGGEARKADAGALQVLVRTDHGLTSRPARRFDPGARVFSKWDQRAWYAGRIERLVGEAAQVVYDDGTRAWVPLDHLLPLKAKPGVKVLGVNKRDGQVIPARLVELLDREVKLRFFDGTEDTYPSARFCAFIDQPGIDFGDPCIAAPDPETDSRPHAKTLWAWRTKKLHYYDDTQNAGPVKTDPSRIELRFVLWIPKDRQAREGWKELAAALAEQTAGFIRRELAVNVEATVHGEPVVGSRPLAWYLKNLDESAAWHVWQPTGESARAAFTDGPQAGRHRVVVVLPDAPGISSDSSGCEKGMGFVRLNGAWFEDLTLEGIKRCGAQHAGSRFDRWTEDQIATTIAHEVLHTVGIPHTDGDPWSVMNIGPWYPICHPKVHVAKLHKVVMRSPFRSLSLSQGWAAWLLDPDRRYLGVVGATRRADTRLRLKYAKGPGFFKLTETLASFGPDTVCRGGDRKYTGDRTLCRAYLASLVAFVLERHGPEALQKAFRAPDAKAATALAEGCSTDVAGLEKAWHAWLQEKTGPSPDEEPSAEPAEEPATSGAGR